MTSDGEGGRDTGAEAWVRPRLVTSACLELDSCRYNGQKVRTRFIPRLAPFVELVPVCPEVEVGLGVPRPAVRLVSLDGSTRMVQPATGRDVTDEMSTFAEGFLTTLGAVDGFLLKGRSPSCGHKDVRVYEANGMPARERGAGLFAAAVAERYPDLAIEDEGRLTNYRLRHHFLTRLFLTARLRALPETMADLVSFHAANKLLLLACSEPRQRALGRLAASPDRRPAGEVKRLYAAEFARALAAPPKVGATINALMHAFGHLSNELKPAERRVFLETLEGYRFGRASLEAPLALIAGWNARYGFDWLARQSLLGPFPDELHDLADSAGASRAA